MDIGGWLRSLGLERYEAAFRENEIDETVLPSLTHETLKELGVTAVGHRLKMSAMCFAASVVCSVVARVHQRLRERTLSTHSRKRARSNARGTD